MCDVCVSICLLVCLSVSVYHSLPVCFCVHWQKQQQEEKNARKAADIQYRHVAYVQAFAKQRLSAVG